VDGFADFPTINSVPSNAAELRLQSRQVVGFPMEIRLPMTRRELASELPQFKRRVRSASGCYASHATGQKGGSRRVQRGISILINTTRPDGHLSSSAMERTKLMVGEGSNRLRAGRLSRHRPDGESRRVPDNRILWKGTDLMRFATLPTINSVSSMQLISDSSDGT
jgi:hypothetical protein